jgi:hypothetical protein
MIKYWVLALILAAVALRYVVRRVRHVQRRKAVVEHVDLPLWTEADRWREAAIDADASADTTPAVLSPPEEPRRAA